MLGSLNCGCPEVRGSNSSRGKETTFTEESEKAEIAIYRKFITFHVFDEDLSVVDLTSEAIDVKHFLKFFFFK